MRVPGLPPELAELLGRLRARGLAVTSLELERLQRLLALDGALAADGDADPLLALLTAVLCKDEPGRALLRREYGVWAAGYLAPPTQSAGTDAEPAAVAADPFGAALRGGGGGADESARRPWRRWLGLVRGWRAPAGGVALLLLGALAWWWFAVAPPPAPPARSGPAAAAPAVPAGALCPADLPSVPAPQVWAWVPVADARPWALLGAGALFVGLLGAAARRLWPAARRGRPAGDRGAGEDAAPWRALPPRPVHGDLLLTPDGRRELVWSIERYLSEDPDRALDPEATVAASARAAGVPHLIRRRRGFPREVWLWCDRTSARPEPQARLVLEVRRALEQANLPVRVARFHGLPGRLTWEDSREPFAPGAVQAAGAAALVAVLTDGAALIRAWENPGERPRLDPLLRELRSWPRLLLVDLGDGGLTRLAPLWRLPVCGGEGLAAWLACARVGPAAAGPAAAPTPPPDPAQLDLWAGACLLAPDRPDQTEAERLRRAMGLHPGPFDDRHLAARLEPCAQDPRLAADLVNRLARAQVLAGVGLPVGDGYFTRALDFWDQRLAQALEPLADDPAALARVRIARACLRLWRDPAGAAADLAAIGGERNGQLIRAALAAFAAGPDCWPAAGPVPRRVPTWDWARLPVTLRWRLRALGLGGRTRTQYGLRRGARHHLALALLAGVGIAGLGWGLERLLRPHRGGDAAFADTRFTGQVIAAPAPGRTWLGSPWRLSPLAALGPLDTPHTWDWQPAANPEPLGAHAAVLTGGTRAFPIRACVDGWPRRALAVVAADRGDQAALKLAIRLLDRGAADRVLIAPDWPARLADLTQGVRLPDDQLLVFLPPGAAAAPDPLADLTGRFAALAEVRGDYEALAGALDFPGARPVANAWPAAATRTLAGAPRASGGPQIRTDRFGVTWVAVCGGTFLMGQAAPDEGTLERYAQSWVDAFGGTLEKLRNDWRGWMAAERPVHPVLVDGFDVTRTEVTNGQDRAAGGSAAGEAALPLANLDWQEARAACDRLEKDQAKLPTEAQWEYAARAGTPTTWPFGEDEDRLGDHAWFRGNADRRAHPVAGKVPNGLCLADMLGNVYEWVRDCYDAKLYGSRGPLTTDPFADQTNCASRVVRGGSFLGPPMDLRPAGRFVIRPDVRLEGLGLRCVRSRARRQ